MKNIFVVAGKEFKEILRDKRTLFFMVIFPLITFPLLINVIAGVTGDFIEEEREKELKVGVSGSYSMDTNPVLVVLDTAQGFTLKELEDTVGIRERIMDDEVDVVLHFDKGFEEGLGSSDSAKVTVIFQGTEETEKGRVDAVLGIIEDAVVANRLAEKDLPPTFIDPIQVVEVNVSSSRETIGKFAGGLLPYFFISFAFLGCLYPAIDMFAGEKERGTIETLLTSPVVRWKILVGKMLVIAGSGLLAATLTMVGLFAGLQFMDMPGELLGAINEILSPSLILSVYLMMIPVIIFFTGLMVPISIYSRSFKEAQSTLTPLNIILVVPAVAGFLPGVELNGVTAFVPIVNIVLATKDIIAGTIDTGLLLITVSTLVLFAVGAVILSFKQFGKESNILR